MLTITLKEQDLFNEETSEFIQQPETIVNLEHSLVSVSKWEQKFKKPFLSPTEKSSEETYYYLYCMFLDETLPEFLVYRFTQDDHVKIQEYIESTQSATTFREEKSTGPKGEIITSELVYYWMVTFSISLDCERWHFNRLLNLIRICNVKQSKPKKVPKAEAARSRQELNARRKAELGTTG